MKIVHIAGVVEEKPKAPSKREKQQVSARRWMEVQEQRNYRAALKEFDSEIKEIQKSCPGWTPIKN